MELNIVSLGLSILSSGTISGSISFYANQKSNKNKTENEKISNIFALPEDVEWMNYDDLFQLQKSFKAISNFDTAKLAIPRSLKQIRDFYIDNDISHEATVFDVRYSEKSNEDFDSLVQGINISLKNVKELEFIFLAKKGLVSRRKIKKIIFKYYRFDKQSREDVHVLMQPHDYKYYKQRQKFLKMLKKKNKETNK